MTCRKSGYKGLAQEAPTSCRILRINNEPSRPTGRVRFCLPRSSSLPHRETLFDQTEMAFTVVATLASSKLAVTQDDLHLVGSTVDQLTVQFNQMAFNELLAADRSNASKRRRSEARQTPSSSTGSALSSDDELVRAPAQPRTHQSAKRSEIPWGLLNRRRREPQIQPLGPNLRSGVAGHPGGPTHRREKDHIGRDTRVYEP